MKGLDVAMGEEKCSDEEAIPFDFVNEATESSFDDYTSTGTGLDFFNDCPLSRTQRKHPETKNDNNEHQHPRVNEANATPIEQTTGHF